MDAQNGVLRQEAKRKFMGVVREDIQIVSVTKEDTEDRERWRTIIILID